MGSYLGKLLPTFLAMLITFLTVGIWHGANWKYVAYGLYNGILIFAGILFEPFLARIFTQENDENKQLQLALHEHPGHDVPGDHRPVFLQG